MLSGTWITFGVGVTLIAYLIYRKMAKAGSPLFKIGYTLYTKTKIGYIYYKRELRKARQKYNQGQHSICTPRVFNGLKIVPIAMSLDNYGYLVLDQRTGTAVLIDPADTQIVSQVLEEENCMPTAILTTHKHWDHSGGNMEWRSRYPDVRVFAGANDNVPGITHPVADGDKLEFGPLLFTVHYTPGHTVGHVVFILDGLIFGAPKCLFSGDHLFLAGMGRIFESSAQTMLQSLDQLTKLPDETLLFPGHEYGVDNLEFAVNFDQECQAANDKLKWCQDKRKDRHSTSPSTMGEERKYNPFLKTDDIHVLKLLGLEKEFAAVPEKEAIRAKALAEIRARKDKFKYKL